MKQSILQLEIVCTGFPEFSWKILGELLRNLVRNFAYKRFIPLCKNKIKHRIYSVKIKKRTYTTLEKLSKNLISGKQLTKLPYVVKWTSQFPEFFPQRDHSTATP